VNYKTKKGVRTRAKKRAEEKSKKKGEEKSESDLHLWVVWKIRVRQRNFERCCELVLQEACGMEGMT
jgi:hypothetical protein